MRLSELIETTAKIVLALVWICSGPSLATAQEGKADLKDDSPAQDTQSAERLANMRRRAEHTHIFVVEEGRQTEVALRGEPVFRYADQPRGIVDGTLWVWGEPGRPVALQKVEYFPPTPTSWTYCLASLSLGLVGAEWRGGRRWTATKPGVEMRFLDDGPEPSTTKPGRMRQMRDLARRFTVKGSEGTSRGEQLRLISQPIHRYADADLEDGAIFGFGSGTNPNCLLLVELHRKGERDERWQYGFIGMSAESLRARLDDREVWYFPPAAKIGGLDSWIWFFETRGMED
ncbi:MAG TPA: hypothetical protein VG125_25590 [Pirellulales bacterium]|jgi:hypothetical protein|nr:hypothetical protein [Pirellulales bacterium]